MGAHEGFRLLGRRRSRQDRSVGRLDLERADQRRDPGRPLVVCIATLTIWYGTNLFGPSPADSRQATLVVTCPGGCRWPTQARRDGISTTRSVLNPLLLAARALKSARAREWDRGRIELKHPFRNLVSSRQQPPPPSPYLLMTTRYRHLAFRPRQASPREAHHTSSRSIRALATISPTPLCSPHTSLRLSCPKQRHASSGSSDGTRGRGRVVAEEPPGRGMLKPAGVF